MACSGLLGAFVAVRGLFGTAVQIRVDQRQRLGHALDLGFGRDTVGARRIGRFGKRSCHTNDRADRNAASDANTLDNHMFSLWPLAANDRYFPSADRLVDPPTSSPVNHFLSTPVYTLKSVTRLEVNVFQKIGKTWYTVMSAARRTAAQQLA